MKIAALKIVVITSTFIAATLIISLFLFRYTQPTYAGSATEVPVLICGTLSNSNEGAIEGKQLFNANCAACHKLDKKATGPALRGISEKLYFGEKTYY